MATVKLLPRSGFQWRVRLCWRRIRHGLLRGGKTTRIDRSPQVGPIPLPFKHRKRHW